MDPVVLFQRAAGGAVDVAAQVRPDQMALRTPCTEWDVAALLAHMQGGPGYLLAAVGVDSQADDRYEAAVARCADALAATATSGPTNPACRPISGICGRNMATIASTISGSSFRSPSIATARSHVCTNWSMAVPAVASATDHAKPAGDKHVRSRAPGARNAPTQRATAASYRSSAWESTPTAARR